LSIGQTRPEDLRQWRGASPSNYYDASPNLARVFALRAGPALLAATGPPRHFGRWWRGGEPAVAHGGAHREFPAHVKYDGLDSTASRSGFTLRTSTPAGHLASAWLALPNDPRRGLRDGGALLPAVPRRRRVATPAGLSARPPCSALGRRGPNALPKGTSTPLRGRDYPRSARGSQVPDRDPRWLRRGRQRHRAGPDVTVDACVAHYREKWFCSVADAQLVRGDGRPEGGVAGTHGLGLVPGTAEPGRECAERFAIRRLKDKLAPAHWRRRRSTSSGAGVGRSGP